MVKERYSNIWPNQTIVSDQSELTILLCQAMNSLLLMKTTLPWYSSLQLLPSYIYDPWLCRNFTSMYFLLVACQMHLWGQSNFWFHQVLSIYLVVAVFWCWKSNYTTHCNDISQPFFQQHKKNVLLYNPVLFPQPL